ncbi:MAG TPA: cytochrome-c peroxidase [Edaphocola sp.]|nr:cytochrome-c peroxidase [Edaphocola sp.]
MSKRKLVYGIAIAGLIFSVGHLASCTNSEQDQQENDSVGQLIEQAASIFKPIISAAEHESNALTAEKIALGKTLYYDVRLSKNNTQSCNSCHNLSTFGVDNLPTSPGDLGGNGARNSPTVLNAAYHGSQFWDGRAKDVEEQAGGPILNPVEMNMPDEKFVENKLKGIKGYEELFKAAFPNEDAPISYANITKAIGAFERTLFTPSRFDLFLKGDQKALTAEEQQGLTTFMNLGCITCHNGAAIGGSLLQKFPLFGEEYMSYTGSVKEDKGKMEETKKETDRFIFKTPSLRNIAKTAPYFHDGSVDDLHKAVKVMGKLQLNKDLTNQEVSSIVAFLNALTGDVPNEAKKIPEMPI